MKNTINILFFVLFIHLSASAQWSELGGINSLNTALNGYDGDISIYTLHCDNNGNAYVGFWNDTAGVAKWNGSVWQRLGYGASNNNFAIYSIATYSSNYLYAASFVNSSSVWYVGFWNGASWIEVGGQNALAAGNIIQSLCTDNTGNLYALYGSNIAKWNGSQWTQIAHSFDIYSKIYSDKQGNIYVGGFYNNAPATGVHVMKWDGATWTDLLGTYPLANTKSITGDSEGNVYIGGQWGISANEAYVLKWNGTDWMELSGTTTILKGSDVFSLCTDKYNYVYALTDCCVLKWTGSDWVDFTDNSFIPSKNLCIDTLGNLYTIASKLISDTVYRSRVFKYANAYAVGVEELGNAKDGLRMFPNPARDWVNVEFSANKVLALKITDISGRELKTQTLTTPTKKIDISDLSNGIYFFSVYQNNRHLRTEKIIKE